MPANYDAASEFDLGKPNQEPPPAPSDIVEGAGKAVPPIPPAPPKSADPEPVDEYAAVLYPGFADALKEQQRIDALPENTEPRRKQREAAMQKIALHVHAIQQGGSLAPLGEEEHYETADCQTEHANAVRLAELARLHPEVAQLIAENAKLKAGAKKP